MLPLSKFIKQITSQIKTKLLFLCRQNTAEVILKKFAMIVTDKNRPIENSYERTLEFVYGADVVPVNFIESEKAAKKINSIVSNYTQGQIQDAVKTDDLLKVRSLLVYPFAIS